MSERIDEEFGEVLSEAGEQSDARRSKKKSKRRDLPPVLGGPRPIVAIVGRPNVGKSTLFNRLAGRHIAIVEDIPGVTRDRHYADATVLGREYILVDTGGFDPHSDDPMAASIAVQVKIALSEADLVVCVLDGTKEPTPADREAIQLLRRSNKPVLFAANKADNPRKIHQGYSYYELGIPKLFPVSALHGHGLGDLEDAMVQALPPPVESADQLPDDILRVAIVGRPNAGKSSLVNNLLGQERQLVDNRPGTTVDSIDTLLTRNGESMVLIDTAGMRRKRSVKGGIEGLGVLQAVRAMERADVVVLMIDATTGSVEQDAKIAGLVDQRGRAMVIGLNKVDLLSEREVKKIETRLREILQFCTWAKVIPLSAKKGTGVNKLMAAVRKAGFSHKKRVPTAECNRFFEEVLDTHPPPAMNNRAVRLLYITQAQTEPPTFIAISNYPESIHFSYQRYVVNQIRKRFGFDGTPVRVFYRKRRRRS